MAVETEQMRHVLAGVILTVMAVVGMADEEERPAATADESVAATAPPVEEEPYWNVVRNLPDCRVRSIDIAGSCETVWEFHGEGDCSTGALDRMGALSGSGWRVRARIAAGHPDGPFLASGVRNWATSGSFSNGKRDGRWLEGECAVRVIRGATPRVSVRVARASHRLWAFFDRRDTDIGFRVVRALTTD